MGIGFKQIKSHEATEQRRESNHKKPNRPFRKKRFDSGFHHISQVVYQFLSHRIILKQGWFIDYTPFAQKYVLYKAFFVRIDKKIWGLSPNKMHGIMVLKSLIKDA
jgi:hypothetical protein